MANQSAKKNEQAIKGKVKFMTFVMYPLFAIFVLINMFFAIGQSVSFWHIIWCILIALLSFFCIKQTIKCWELQLPPQASEYYLDILALNTLVAILDPFTHKVWHVYWLVLVFALVKGGRYLWDYITPKYEEPEEGQKDGKKQKKEKKQKIKYIKA